jgi:hypothetical protein
VRVLSCQNNKGIAGISETRDHYSVAYQAKYQEADNLGCPEITAFLVLKNEFTDSVVFPNGERLDEDALNRTRPNNY